MDGREVEIGIDEFHEKGHDRLKKPDITSIIQTPATEKLECWSAGRILHSALCKSASTGSQHHYSGPLWVGFVGW